MKKAIALTVLLFVFAGVGRAQTIVTFTFNNGYGTTKGTTNGCVNVLSQDSTVFPQPYLPNPWTGYEMCFDGGGYGPGPGFFIDLDQQVTPSMPNNGYLAQCDPLAYGSKAWGTRANGTTMDGTQIGDSFVWPANTSCPYGNVNVHINENWTYTEQNVRVCVSVRCHYVQKLLPFLEGGNGFVTY